MQRTARKHQSFRRNDFAELTAHRKINAIRRAHDVITVGAPPPLQEAAVTALNLPDTYYVYLRESYQARRDLLESIPGVGERVAVTILGELPNIHEFRSGKAVAAFAGLPT